MTDDLHPLVNKPAWMDTLTWRQLLAKYDGAPRCDVTGETENLSVDHIKPRYEGGTHDVSNLRFLVNRINAKKGVRPDDYWSQSFYWDRMPDLDQLRGAQRELFFTITEGYGDWFGRPLSQISSKLYVNSWVVGGGKTIGIPVAAWAINYIQRRQLGVSTRADRILVVTKEIALRDQLARDLETDITRYGIYPSAPRVAVVRKSSQFEQTAWIDSHDIVVTCLQSLWSKNDNDKKREDIRSLLSRFPVIAFDEPHYGAERIYDLVEDAFQSVCFGFTGSPINESGKLLERMVGLTTYGYETAVSIDGSLKYLSSDADGFSQFVHEISIDDADIYRSGERETVKDANEVGYSKNLIPAKSVFEDMVSRAKSMERLEPAKEQLAPHRAAERFVIDGAYPVHLMIVCDSIDTAERLFDYGNDFFTEDSFAWPREDGWCCEVVHSGRTGEKGRGLPAKPLGPDHPWMRWKNTGRLDRDCARVLFVVGMGREGVNNPACGLVGLACSQNSVVGIVQQPYGRQLRAVTTNRGAMIGVPPAPLDRVSIVTHETFKNSAVLSRGARFICDMEAALEKLPSVGDLMEGKDKPRTPEEETYHIPLKEKLEVVERFSRTKSGGAKWDVDDVVQDVIGLDTGLRPQRLREWAQKVYDAPEDAFDDLGFSKAIKPMITVLRETVQVDPSDDELQRYALTHVDDEELLGELVPVAALADDGTLKKMLRREYRKHIEQYHQITIKATGHIDDIRHQLAGTVKRRLKGYYEGDDQLVHSLVGSAVKQKLGVPPKVVAGNGSDWDIAQVHAILHRPEVQAEILNWVCGRLIDEGKCPSLTALHAKACG